MLTFSVVDKVGEMSLFIKMEVDALEDAACLDPELLQLPEVSPFALKTSPQLVEDLFSQWLSLPETGHLVIYLFIYLSNFCYY